MLERCGCCTGIEFQTPVQVENRPGLNAIAYRIGQHSSFKASMLARLSREIPDLNTRDDADFTIALLDAWSTVADVLTFYQERIANESYLRTATERLSLLELARLIGYELRPGVSANAHLAFTLENDVGEITIAAGAQAQHVPAEGELPQKFETSIDILARPEWNEIKARQTDRHPYIENGSLRSLFYFEGVVTNLRVGDRLLITPDTGDQTDGYLRVVSSVGPQPEQSRTEVRVIDPESAQTTSKVSAAAVSATAVGTTPATAAATSAITQEYYDEVVLSSNLSTYGLYQNFYPVYIYQNLAATQPLPPGILTFRNKASIFGHHAPKWDTLPASLRVGEVVPILKSITNDGTDIIIEKYRSGPYNDSTIWVDNRNLTNVLPGSFTTVSNERFLHLDTTYDVVAGSTVVLQDGTEWLHGEVIESTDISVSEYTLSAKVTRIRVRFEEDVANLNSFSVRGTSVYLQSETLSLARLPIEAAVEGNQIRLEGWIDGLVAGQSIILCGEIADDLGNHACEHAVIDVVEQSITHEGGTTLTLKESLNNRYVRKTVTINANVAPANHGESKVSPLGSGDGSIPFQQFPLPDKPLTHVSSETHSSGAEAALEMRVNNIRWHQVDDLRESQPGDRHYMLRHTNDGSTSAHFGDGVQGARLPSGMENVQASYRFGTGTTGNVPAETIRLLARRPLGVRSVVNPLDANGGADPEARDEARVNAPLATLTLDRIVSLKDYEDFARAFAGISKALATWTWFGQERGVFLTVAGAGGSDVVDPVHTNLLTAIRNASDPSIPVRVGKGPSYRSIFFQLSGSLTINPDYEAELLLIEAEMRLRTHFSFAQRTFGQDVTLSEVIAILQATPGVVAVDIDEFYPFDPTRQSQMPKLHQRLRADVPQIGARAQIDPAQLLLLDPAPTGLGVA